MHAPRPYCAVSVKVTTGWPSPNGPSALTCTTPGFCGKVKTTGAFPDESVTTMRLDNDPASVVNRIVAPGALPPDFPGFNVTDRFSWLPVAPF